MAKLGLLKSFNFLRTKDAFGILIWWKKSNEIQAGSFRTFHLLLWFSRRTVRHNLRRKRNLSYSVVPTSLNCLKQWKTSSAQECRLVLYLLLSYSPFLRSLHTYSFLEIFPRFLFWGFSPFHGLKSCIKRQQKQTRVHSPVNLWLNIKLIATEFILTLFERGKRPK